MANFIVEIEKTPGSANTILFTMEPYPDVMDIARHLSVAYSGCLVKVSAHARIRRLYKNGIIAASWPDLTKFYSGGISDKDKWDWTCWGKVLD